MYCITISAENLNIVLFYLKVLFYQSLAFDVYLHMMFVFCPDLLNHAGRLHYIYKNADLKNHHGLLVFIPDNA